MESAQEAKSARVVESVAPSVKWSWAARKLDARWMSLDVTPTPDPPTVGDMAVFDVDSIGHHESLVSADNRKVRIYPADSIVGVFGHRYATDAYEAEVSGLDDLSLLTAGGLVGTIRSAHAKVGRATRLRFRGYLLDASYRRANLKTLFFHDAPPPKSVDNLIVVVGTSMNAGKTTVVSRLVRGLVARGLSVAACKFTGSVSNRDSDEMRAASPCTTRDFSDYGFPSTYLASKEELRGLWSLILRDTSRALPDVTVMEIADGILQRETEIVLADPWFRGYIRGLILAAGDGMGALYAVDRLKRWHQPVWAVSGLLTSSPLQVREFRAHSDVPVLSSAGTGDELANALLPRLRKPEIVRESKGDRLELPFIAPRPRSRAFLG